MSRILLALILVFSTLSVQAQNNSGGGEERPSVVEKYGPRRQISTIVYMGLAGAVLGLSTLSFYGRPQDKLTNIPIGFGVGVVIGTIYMTYQAATNPDEFYSEARYEYKPHFSAPTLEENISVADVLVKKDQPSFSYGWSF